ncbi:GNAT family N-acetyltransferase [bacterium]|nr:GNAT family N-acetyltransferase [bacterium]
MADIKVLPIHATKGKMRKFVKFAWEIYCDNPNWVPPLIHDQASYITEGPYHETGVIQPFLAYREGEIVGRIIAHYDTHHNEYHNQKRGCIGFFECINDTRVSRALFDASKKWLLKQGMTEMYGPLSFIVYGPSGLLIDDYDNQPSLDLAYNPPYYIDLFLDYGFQKSSDWYAYLCPENFHIPQSLYKIRDKVLTKNKEITFRNFNPKAFEQDNEKYLDVFNKAWQGNWEHLPFKREHFFYIASSLKPVVKPEFIIMAEHKEKLVGFILAVPDITPAIKAANGRIFPFGFIKMLWAMRTLTRIKVFMMGVLPEYRNRGLDAVFLLYLIERGKKMGFKEADCSLLAETNTQIIKIVTHLGAQKYKTFRHYSLSIA